MVLNEFIIMVVKTCVMACPNISSDLSQNSTILEPSASLACHILQYLFTSAPRALIYRRTTPEQRMVTATLRNICFSTFLIVLKCLFLLSEPKKDVPNINTNKISRNSSSSSRLNERFQAASSSSSGSNVSGTLANAGNGEEPLELDQFALSLLQEICENDWIKERCYHEGDSLLKTNQLLEAALGRKAQNLLHIICYPPTHYIRKMNEQAATKDFIRIILQNLDIWNLREALLEFKLMIELERQKEQPRLYVSYYIFVFTKCYPDFQINGAYRVQENFL